MTRGLQRVRRLLDIANLRAAWWALGALLSARNALSRGELKTVRLESPPSLPASAGWGVEALLRRKRHSCLEGALVRQRWLAAHGQPRDVVIGVTSPSNGFIAHAWLADERDPVIDEFQELTRFVP